MAAKDFNAPAANAKCTFLMTATATATLHLRQQQQYKAEPNNSSSVAHTCSWEEGVRGLQQATLFRVWLRQAVGQAGSAALRLMQIVFSSCLLVSWWWWWPQFNAVCALSAQGVGCTVCRGHTPLQTPTPLTSKWIYCTDRCIYIYIYSVYLLYMCPICALSCFFFVARNTFMSLPLSLSSLCNPLKLSRIGTATTTTTSSLLAQCSS